MSKSRFTELYPKGFRPTSFHQSDGISERQKSTLNIFFPTDAYYTILQITNLKFFAPLLYIVVVLVLFNSININIPPLYASYQKRGNKSMIYCTKLCENKKIYDFFPGALHHAMLCSKVRYGLRIFFSFVYD